MIQIQINPARVERVLFVSDNETEEDFDFAAWQAIRPLVNKIDRRLRQIVAALPTSDRQSRRTPRQIP